MPAISPTASLTSSESSVSSCSDISVEANFYDRQYAEDSSTDSSQEYSSSLLNGFHQLNNLGKHENGEIGNSDNVVPTKTVEVLEGAENNAERSNLLDDQVDAGFWLPPEAEDHEDDITGRVANYEDDDEFGDGVTWANPSSLSSFGEGGCESYKLREEKIKAVENVRNGKFRNLVRQLVKSVGIDPGNCGESWVDIVTDLSWEAATFVKPDTAEGKAMDPDGHVKIKCIASDLRTQSRVIKGLVFKKHAAHKHMPTNYKNPRLLLIHGSLDLSSDGLSSFQAMTQGNNNLKSIVDMIDMYHPNVVLVEKSVSGDIQESILAKGMTLVFDMKLHRLERVARCIGSPILSSEVAIGQKLRQCDSFHIEKFVEEHVSTEAGKKQRKTLMFLEGSPSRLGCTILLMGANSDELKRIKCVVRCAVVMAYHLMLETSFLLDQSAMFSTISKNITSTLETNIPNHYDPNAEENNSCTLDIPISNGFHEMESENLIPLSESNSSMSFESYNHETFPGLSLSTSIQEVMNDSFPSESSDKLNCDSVEDHVISKDEISAVLDSESILVLMWSRNASKGTMCKQSRFSHIKFYRDFDVPLGKYLQENLLNQGLECKSCGAPPEVHVFYYAHRNKQLTIQVRKLPAGKGLPGETEGKLWMWGRCGLCKFHERSSNSTRRVLISTTARGLSFGKFLELSFSNNSASDSPSSCGYSFQKDFLYFFGLGPMIAMFKYSTVATYTVSLPPQRMEYKSSVKGEFLKKDIENVYMKGMSMFLDVEKCLKDIATRYVGVILNIQGSSKEFSDIVELLEQEKSQFEVNIQSALSNESEDGGLYELLTLNRIRLELLLESCIWDRRLHALLSSHPKMINADSVDSDTQEHFLKESETEQEFSAPHVETDNSPVKEIQIDGLIEGENHFSNSFISSLELKKDKPMSRNHSLNGKHPSLLSNLEENDKSWIWAPLADILREYTEDLHRGYLPKIESFSSYPLDSMAQKLINDEGSRLHIPLGSDNTSDYIVSAYEDEFSSIIACALALLKDIPIPTENLSEYSKSNDSLTRVFSFNTPQWSSFGSMDSDSVQSPPSKSSSFDGVDLLDSLVSYSSHPEVSMGLGKFQAKRKYSVVCLFASQFRQLRDRFCSSEVDYIASLSRCRKWDAKGGKSKSFFAKTLDDRFIIKEIKRTEFDSFVKFATNYFDYMNDCYELGNQTCLAKILGIYQVVLRATKNGKETRHELLIMENLSFGRHIVRQYDLKGAMHARFSDEGNKPGNVLLDQNFVNDMSVSPLYVSRKSKQKLQRAVYNDTNFLNANNVMDYSLLVGVDTQQHELTCGIIDYLRQYTWDKQLENWVKSSLVVPKNTLPTIISPIDYKTRFRKFINTHFLSVPDHWCSQRSSKPCKLCGSALQNGSIHKKCQKRGNQDDDSSHGTSQKHGKHEDGSLKSSNHGVQNGIFS